MALTARLLQNTEFWMPIIQRVKFKIFQPRERGLEYSISHYGNNWYVLTNKDKALNFKLMKTSEDKTSKENWVDMIPHRSDVLFGGH